MRQARTFYWLQRDCCCTWVRLAAWYFCGKRTGTIKRWIGCILQWQICNKKKDIHNVRKTIVYILKKRCFTLIFPKLQSFGVTLQLYTMWKRQCEKDNVRKTIVNNDRFVKQKKREAHTMWERQWSVKMIFQFGTTLMFPMYIKKDVSIGKHWYSQCI